MFLLLQVLLRLESVRLVTLFMSLNQSDLVYPKEFPSPPHIHPPHTPARPLFTTNPLTTNGAVMFNDRLSSRSFRIQVIIISPTKVYSRSPHLVPPFCTVSWPYFDEF